MLPGVIDRLTGGIAASFRKFSRGRVEARADTPGPARFAGFVEAIPAMALIAVARTGDRGGRCLAVIDGDLANVAIGLLLGGRGDSADIPAGLPSEPSVRSGYTAIEQAVVERFARDHIAAALANAFAPVAPFHVALDYLTSDPAELSIAAPAASCVTWRVSLTVDGRAGSIAFLLPYASVEPIRAQLSRDPSGPGEDRDADWRAHLHTELPHAGMALRAVIERRRISAMEVLRWRVGSTLLLHRHHEEPIDVFCNDMLILRARMAEQGGRVALHVEERRVAEDWPGPG
jgi:flagellar motor switch protein FliM